MDPSAEQRVEALLQTMRKSAVENYGARGREWGGDKSLESAYNRAMNLAEIDAGQVVIVETAVPNEVAVCAAVKGKRMDGFDRSGTMGVVVTMSRVDAGSLVREMEKSPDVLFEVIKKVNGGPIKRFDGSTAEVEVPPNLKVLPTVAGTDTRASYRGKAGQTKWTGSFPAGYIPW